MSLFGSVFPIGAMIGPIFGGLFVKYWSWRGVFFVNVPLGLLILALAWRFIPRDPAKDRSTGLTMDWVGMGLMGAAVLAAMFSTNALGAPGGDGGPWGFWALLAGATLATGLFVRHVRGASTPFIAPSLIWGSGFGPVNAVNAIFGGMTIGAVALVPLYAANRYGMDALAAGTLLIAQGIAAIALSLAATWALRRTGYRRPMWVGACAIVAGLGVLAVQAPEAIGPTGGCWAGRSWWGPASARSTRPAAMPACSWRRAAHPRWRHCAPCFCSWARSPRWPWPQPCSPTPMTRGVRRPGSMPRRRCFCCWHCP